MISNIACDFCCKQHPPAPFKGGVGHIANLFLFFFKDRFLQFTTSLIPPLKGGRGDVLNRNNSKNLK